MSNALVIIVCLPLFARLSLPLSLSVSFSFSVSLSLSLPSSFFLHHSRVFPSFTPRVLVYPPLRRTLLETQGCLNNLGSTDRDAQPSIGGRLRRGRNRRQPFAYSAPAKAFFHR